MLSKEVNYQFRSRIDAVHSPDVLDENAKRENDEIAINAQWVISCPADATDAMKMAAADLEDYFLVSMKMALTRKVDGKTGIVLGYDKNLNKPSSFKLIVAEDKIEILGKDDAGLRAGNVYLEDLLNLRGAPYLKKGETVVEKLISPRIVHSGWGIELFPDSHLNAILHAGFDAVVVFCTGNDQTNIGYLDFNDLIRRAAKFGLAVYLYSYLPAYKHPDDPDAKEFFENVYTRLFERYPGAAGVMLVGESAGFPSKDPRTTGRKIPCNGDGDISDTRPQPGWFPCSDYPAWIKCVRDAVWKAKPGARIIFNTYNWGWTSPELRREFLKNIPEGITIQVTFDIFARRKLGNLEVPVMDYSVTADKPGFYFDSECHIAAEYKRPLLSTANTAGMTWDFGDVPYMPAPQRWIRRFRELDRFRRECGLSAFYDNHHYGWWPTVITEVGKWFFRAPQCDPEELLKRLAARMAGAGANDLLAAWQSWSDAFDHLPATNEDQYGPLRVGPSYPFIFGPNITRTMANKEIKFPTDPKAHFGYRIIKTLYQPYENVGQLPASLRYPTELAELKKFDELWGKGLASYEKAIAAAPEKSKEKLERELNIGRFIRLSARTCYNVKHWWCLNRDLLSIKNAEEGNAMLDKISAIADEEEANVKAAYPLVEADSRLGWEPSMEYVCDAWHLDWKMRQLAATRREIAEYRQVLTGK